LQRAAFVLTVRQGREEAYRHEHTRVWPELVDEARQCGVRNQSVYLHGRTIFVYLEAEDIDQCLRALETAPVNARWDRFMSDFIEPQTVRLREVFHMD
jgi:L-rhamnose mutarotase